MAIRAGWSLFIELNGGLARRPEVSSDGFTMVICHELGHFLAGLDGYSERFKNFEVLVEEQ